MRLGELCRNVSVSAVCGRGVRADEVEVRKITVDSRLSGPDAVFAPILGYRENGGDYVADAYSRGCRVFLSETAAEPKDNCIILKTKSIRKSVAELSAKIYDYAPERVRIIGITGTKGKTTIALSIAKILSMANIRAFGIGTMGLSDGDGNIIEKTKNTTPEPTELHRLIREAVDRGAEVIALEVSSQAIMDFRVYGIEFSAVVFSSLGVDHIGESEHESFTEYVRAKRALFTDYKAEYRIFNADDAYTPYVAFGTEKCIKCGFSERSDYRITDFSFSSQKSSFKLSGVEVVSKMPAKYDAVNVGLAIVAASLVTGKSISELAPHISSVKLYGRFERHTVNGRVFIIDYAHNKFSFVSVLSLARRLYGGKIISVFGSVGDRSRARRRELAEAAELYSDFSVITSDNPGFEPPEKICGEIADSFKDRSRCEICVDREAAILRAYEISLPGDVIMLLGKGHEEEMNVRGESLPFSERKIIEKLKGIT